MKFKLILGFLLVLIGCSGNLKTSEGKLAVEDSPNTHFKSNIGLKIEYKPTRGQTYTDTIGNKYNLRHIPAIITNDSSIPIQIHIAFLKEYDYPITYTDKQFKVFPMPKEWALDGVEITNETLNELPTYIDNPFLNKTLAPGEKWLLAFGTLCPKDINYGVFPVAIFSHDHRDLSHECKYLINPDKLTIPHLALELLIGFTSGSQASPDSCMTIPCGKISYTEH